jgi:uncharacterized protein YndB with AHSA1/START domain
MSSQTRIMKAPPTAVWEVLADGWLYPLWVVGASRIREVDASWPEQGAQIAHSVGAWPMLIDDTTEVTECRAGQLLALRARAWPAGEAAVEIRLNGSGPDTEVTMMEDAVTGPAVLVPKPVRDVALSKRNAEALRRLAYLAERRASRP